MCIIYNTGAMSNKIKILIFDKDELTKTLVENYLKEVEFPFELYKYGNFDKSLVKNDESYKFIFVDVNGTNMSILTDISILSKNEHNIFVLFSAAANTDLYVKSLRSGAKEFLRKPLVKADFLKAVNNNFQPEMLVVKEVVDKTKIISVTSYEKGCGKTFFSINLAKEIADITNEKVLLLDFNDNINNVAFSLDIDSFVDTQDFIQHFNEENARAYLSKINKYKNSSLYILSNGLYKSRVDNVRMDCVERFFNIVVKYFKYIIIDVNQELDIINSFVFDKSDTIFYMISTSITASEKNRKYISTNANNKKFKILLNKYKSKDEAKLVEIESNLAKEIFTKIPMSLMVTAGSNHRGKTIREINPNMDIVDVYNKIAKYTIVYRA